MQQRLIGHHSEEELDKNQATLEALSLGLRTAEGIQFDRYEKLFDESFLADFVDSVGWGERYHLLKVSRNSVKVSNKGFIMVNSIVERFF